MLIYQIQGCFYQFTFVDSEKEITSDFATIIFILVEESRGTEFASSDRRNLSSLNPRISQCGFYGSMVSLNFGGLKKEMKLIYYHGTLTEHVFRFANVSFEFVSSSI